VSSGSLRSAEAGSAVTRSTARKAVTRVIGILEDY